MVHLVDMSIWYLAHNITYIWIYLSFNCQHFTLATRLYLMIWNNYGYGTDQLRFTCTVLEEESSTLIQFQCIYFGLAPSKKKSPLCQAAFLLTHLVPDTPAWLIVDIYVQVHPSPGLMPLCVKQHYPQKDYLRHSHSSLAQRFAGEWIHSEAQVQVGFKFKFGPLWFSVAAEKLVRNVFNQSWNVFRGYTVLGQQVVSGLMEFTHSLTMNSPNICCLTSDKRQFQNDCHISWHFFRIDTVPSIEWDA